jgi:hypothetical protein
MRIFTGWLLVWTAGTLLAGTRDAQWKKVEDALDQGLPRTAITNLEPIITGALRDSAYAEATKAVARKITLEGSLEGSRAEASIARLTARLRQAPTAMKPMLETLLAHWYWQ